MYDWKNDPVAPSARNQRVLGRVTPAVPVPPSNGRAAPLGKYIARSAMIGAVAVTSRPNDVPGTPGTDPAQIVVRLCAGRLGVSTTGPPLSRRKRTVAVTADALSLAS